LAAPPRPLGRGGGGRLRHLLGQLAGGQDDQSLRLALGAVRQLLPPLLARSRDRFEHGDAEAEGFARPRLRLADDVVSPESDGESERLYGERMDDPSALQGFDDGLRNA